MATQNKLLQIIITRAPNRSANGPAHDENNTITAMRMASV